MRNGNKRGSKETNYEHGPFHYGEGSTPISDECLWKIFVHGLSGNELHTLEILSRFAWLKRSLLVRASTGFMSIATEIGVRSVEKYLGPDGELRARGFLRLEKLDLKYGNTYFVEPVLIWSSKWNELAHFETSKLFTLNRDELNRMYAAVSSAKNAVLVEGSAKSAERFRKKCGTRETPSRSQLRKIFGEYRSDLFRSDGAPRYEPPTEIEGGVHADKIPPSPPLKGVALSGDATSFDRRGEACREWQRRGRPGPLSDFIKEFLSRAAETPLPGLETPEEAGPAGTIPSARDFGKERLALATAHMKGEMTFAELRKRNRALKEAEKATREAAASSAESPTKRRPQKKVGRERCAISVP